MKTLYLHIGTTKTGTTAIQSFCIGNQEVLGKKGYCYPLFSYRYKDVSERRNAHFLLAEASDRNAGIFREGMDKIHSLFREYPNIILSDEGIWSAQYGQRMEMWRALRAEAKEGGFQVKVIVYLRRQDMYLISGWNQMVKSGIGNGAGKPWKDYVAELAYINKMNYATHLKKIAAFWGRENLAVRRFEPGHFVGGTIYSDFLHTVGLAMTEEYRAEQPMRNTRLAGNTHEIQRVLNGMPGMKPAYHSFFRQALLSYAELSGAEYPCEMFSRAEAEAFMDHYKEENRRVSEAYFGGGELFETGWKDVPKWEKDNPHMQDDLIRFVGACCMLLMEDNLRLGRQIDEVKERLRHPIRELSRRQWRKLRDCP